MVSGNRLRKGGTKSCGLCYGTANPKPYKIKTNEIGRKYYSLTVVSAVERSERPFDGQGRFWVCRCDCGNEVIARQASLRDGTTKSCLDCSYKKKLEMQDGQVFGEWTIINAFSGTKGKCLALCSCGIKRVVSRGILVSGHSTSCGHDLQSRRGLLQEKHGYHRSSEYCSWSSMIQRCHNPKSQGYPYYGAKGIAVCQPWLDSFVEFLKDMGPKPTPQHTIDRLENDKGYFPGNTRWATKAQQAKNIGPITTSTIKIWAFSRGVDWAKFSRAILAGEEFEAALEISWAKNDANVEDALPRPPQEDEDASK